MTIDRRGDRAEIAFDSLAVSVGRHEKTEPFCTKTRSSSDRACERAFLALGLGHLAPDSKNAGRTKEQIRPAIRISQCDSEHMSPHLRHDHALLLNSLLHGKLPRNLSWDKVIGLIAELGEVIPHSDQEFTFVIGSQQGSFRRPHGHDLEVEEVSHLRKFLKEAQLPDTLAPVPPSGRTVVVIDHHTARIFHDTVVDMGDEKTVRPYDPFHFHHHLIHRKEAHYRGERVPEENEFYEEIAKQLVPAIEIVLIGHATGTSSAANYLSEYLKQHHSTIAARIVATERADLSSLTEPDIESLARRHHSSVSSPPGLPEKATSQRIA